MSDSNRIEIQRQEEEEALAEKTRASAQAAESLVDQMTGGTAKIKSNPSETSGGILDYKKEAERVAENIGAEAKLSEKDMDKLREKVAEIWNRGFPKDPEELDEFTAICINAKNDLVRENKEKLAKPKLEEDLSLPPNLGKPEQIVIPPAPSEVLVPETLPPGSLVTTRNIKIRAVKRNIGEDLLEKAEELEKQIDEIEGRIRSESDVSKVEILIKEKTGLIEKFEKLAKKETRREMKKADRALLKEQLLQPIQRGVEEGEHKNALEVCLDHYKAEYYKKWRNKYVPLGKRFLGFRKYLWSGTPELKEDSGSPELEEQLNSLTVESSEFTSWLEEKKSDLRKKSGLSVDELSDQDIDAIINNGYYVDQMRGLNVGRLVNWTGFSYEIPTEGGENIFVTRNMMRVATLGVSDAIGVATNWRMSPVSWLLRKEFKEGARPKSLKTILLELKKLSVDMGNERNDDKIYKEAKPEELEEIIMLKSQEYFDEVKDREKELNPEKEDAKKIEAKGLYLYHRGIILKNAGEDALQEELKEKFANLREEFGEACSFSPEEMQQLEEIDSNSLDARQRVKELSELYRGDEKGLVEGLVEKLTGVICKSHQFDISTSPMSIDIVADDDVAEEIYKAFGKTNEDAVVCFGGFETKSKVSGVFITVIKRNSQYMEAYVDHEQTHVESSIFGNVIDEKVNFGIGIEDLLGAYNAEKNRDGKRRLLGDYFLLKRKKDFQRVAKEIFSMKKDGVSNYYDLFFGGGMYDTLADFRNNKGKSFEGLIFEISLSSDWKNLSDKYLVKEYREIFNKSLDAFERFKGKGYNLEHINNMLRYVPFEDWEKFANHLLGPVW